jgi:Icc-related predicted phosphoesterase
MSASNSGCFFVSDLHGSIPRYETLLDRILMEKPAAVFLGGDLLPGLAALADVDGYVDFLQDFLMPRMSTLREQLGADYPAVFMIFGNDDPRVEEETALEGDELGLWHYCQGRRVRFGRWSVYGYSFIPPTPFLNKDWEKYDVSRFVDPGCVSPEEGRRTVAVEPSVIRYSTIKDDLRELTGGDDLSGAILLCHTPPYRTKLDRAALDEVMIDHVPADVHVGSIALKELMESRGPLLGLHGHIHESARLTGDWKDRIGRTIMYTAAHDGPELCLVRFDPEFPDQATRELKAAVSSP